MLQSTHEHSHSTWHANCSLPLSILLPLVKSPAGLPWPHTTIRLVHSPGSWDYLQSLSPAAVFTQPVWNTQDDTILLCFLQASARPRTLTGVCSQISTAKIRWPWFRRITVPPLDVCNCILLAASFCLIFHEGSGDCGHGLIHVQSLYSVNIQPLRIHAVNKTTPFRTLYLVVSAPYISLCLLK